MNPPQNHEETIFEAVLQLPPEQRATHLMEACGDDAQLRQRVERLLQAHEKAAGDFLEKPRALGPNKTIVVSAPLPAGEQPGTMIGRYKLLEKIGEGGFGVVYVAEQREPVKRRVALKIIKLGMDTRQVVARFEVERQALALMDHPNIAKVFDAGTTETGRPYFVMELVRGIRITDYCDQNNLSTKERLELFAKVCQAIQHAHQKGIIHRDIKPSNILVTLHDGMPVPKVIDFGIAKATQGELTEHTVYTQLQQFIGTPAYMSPEQAEMSGLDIDTRSDIYALGVLLYELLTGRTPFDQKELLEAGLDGMRRIIREQEPARPSTRVSSLQGEDRTMTAKRHGLDAPKLVHLLQGDLDWIVMKCLEKDRTRRYETANGVAMDLQRYLGNEPVLARPPSASYRFQKFARRNKLAFAAGSAVALALCLGVVASTWQAVRATREQRNADRERERAQTEAKRADENAKGETRQRHAAEQAVQKASQALSMSLVVEGDRLAHEGNSAKALANLARALRLDPVNRVAAQRIISLLSQRDFPLPLPGRPESAGFDPFKVAANSADGRRFCLVTNQNMVVVFNSDSGRPVGKPYRFDAEPTWARLNDDGTRLAVGMSNSASFWDCDTGHKLAEIQGDIEALSPDRHLAVISKNLVDVDSGRSLFSLAKYSYQDRPVFSPDASKMAFLSSSNIDIAVVLATATGERIAEITTPWHGSRPYLRFAADSRNLIIAGFTSGLVQVWDVVKSRQANADSYNRSTVRGLDLSRDGRLLAGALRNGEVNVWNLRDDLPAREPCPGNRYSDAVRCAPDGSWLAAFSPPTGDKPAEIKWWDIRPGRAVPISLFHPAGLGAALLLARGENGGAGATSYSPDGSLLKTIDRGGNLRLWRAEDGTLLYPPISYGGGVGVAVFSPDSTVMATGATDGEIRLWDTPTGRLLKTLGRHTDFVTDIVFTPDGRYLVSSANQDILKLWDTRSGELVVSQKGVPGRGQQLEIDPTGKRLAVASESFVQILDVPSLRLLTDLAQGQGAFSVHFSHDGKSLSTSSTSEAALIWDGLTGQGPLVRLPHGSGVYSAIFSPDDRLVVTASYDRTARVWDRATGVPVTEPLPQPGMTVKALFGPNNRTVITASSTAVVWDVRTGRALSEEFRNETGVQEACFSPDGRHVLIAERDGLVRIHEWIEAPENPPAWLSDLAEAVGGYRLSENGVAELIGDAAQILAQLRLKLGTADSATNARSAAPPDALVEWGQWYLADRGTRTISPHSRLTGADYAGKLAQRGGLRILEEAADLRTGNPSVYQNLAAVMQASQPETANLYRRIAIELGGDSNAPPSIAALAAPATPTPPPGSAKDGFVDPLDGTELLKHVGETVKVRGEIMRFAPASTTPMFFLNFSGNYRSSLTLVFKPEINPAEFRAETLRAYVHKTVIVEGKIISFQGRPEIDMTSLSQMKEVEGTPPAGDAK